MARTHAGALLVCDCYTDRGAVNPARNADVIARTHRRERAGRICRGDRSNLLRPKPCRIRADGLSAWTDVVRLSTGQAGLSVCECHVGDRRTHPTCGTTVVNSCTPVHRSLTRNSGGTCRCRGLAGGGPDHYFLTPQSRILAIRSESLPADWPWLSARDFAKPRRGQHGIKCHFMMYISRAPGVGGRAPAAPQRNL
jgi:hypothetical protein